MSPRSVFGSKIAGSDTALMKLYLCLTLSIKTASASTFDCESNILPLLYVHISEEMAFDPNLSLFRLNFLSSRSTIRFSFFGNYVFKNLKRHSSVQFFPFASATKLSFLLDSHSLASFSRGKLLTLWLILCGVQTVLRKFSSSETSPPNVNSISENITLLFYTLFYRIVFSELYLDSYSESDENKFIVVFDSII